MGAIAHLPDFPVIELRRYALHEGEAHHFALCFESYFPEAFQQLGAIIFGHFVERSATATFTWLRGYPDMDTRLSVNTAFYDGPLWKEHAESTNKRLVDHSNVLLLRPLEPGRGLPVLPAVDPVGDVGATRGVAVAQIFAIAPGRVAAFAREAEDAFACYRNGGTRELGTLVTLDATNNFPRHPVREDSPYLVWLGLAENDHALKTRFGPLSERLLPHLFATGLLRRPPEEIVLDPSARSRLRWL